MCDHPNREAAMVVLDPGTPERNGRDGVWCDPCLAPLITALNAGGLSTTASCCGHGEPERLGWVMLADGRVGEWEGSRCNCGTADLRRALDGDQL